MEKKRFDGYSVISVCSVIGFLLLWQAATDWFGWLPSIAMPSPVRTLTTLITKLTQSNPEGATMLQHIVASLSVSVTGFLAGSLIGVPLGIFMAWNRRIEMLAMPLFDFIKPIPPIAWIPLMIIVFGIGVAARAAIIFMAALMPCVINAYTGIKQVNQVHLWVGRIFGATRRQLLLRVAIPTALPSIFTGLRVALGASWISLVAAEMLAATRGLGYMIQAGRLYLMPDMVVAGMVVIGCIGALLSFVLTKFENHLIRGRR
jgi:NitT/TauT family transport system permease protein/taurine transport system permease protein